VLLVLFVSSRGRHTISKRDWSSDVCSSDLYLQTDKSKGIRHGKQDRKRMRRCRFSIGSAPLTSITKSDAQISGGETRQDYKDTKIGRASCRGRGWGKRERHRGNERGRGAKD